MTQMRAKLVNACLLLVSSFLALAMSIVIEINVWPQAGDHDVNWHDPNTKFDSRLGWVPVPGRSIAAFGDKKISSNALGFRSPEVDSSKKHVLIVGDSVAWGFGVGDEETVSSYLQQYADHEAPGRQVLNLAVSGYSLDQYAIYLRENIQKVNPEIIIVIICALNDLEETARNYAYGKSKPLFVLEENKLVQVNERIPKYSRLNLFSTTRIFPFLVNLFAGEARKGKILGMRELDSATGRLVSAALLEDIKTLSSRHQARLIFVLSPSIFDFENESQAYSFFKNLFNRDGGEYIDFRQLILGDHVDLKNLFRDSDFTHYSPEGNDYLAWMIHQKIRSRPD